MTEAVDTKMPIDAVSVEACVEVLVNEPMKYPSFHTCLVCIDPRRANELNGACHQQSIMRYESMPSYQVASFFLLAQLGEYLLDFL